MVGKDRALSICHEALRLSQADQTQVTLSINDINLSRYANNSIHQNILEANVALRVKAVIGKKTGTAVTNQLDSDSIAQAVARALAIARLQKDNPEFTSLPAPRPLRDAPSFFPDTAEIDPEAKAQSLSEITTRARAKRLVAAGAFNTTNSELTVVNSLGVSAYQQTTTAGLTCVVMDDEGSGYAARSSRNVSSINAAEVAEEAIATCLLNRRQITIDPGEYTVILKEYAASEMLSYLSYMGFAAMAYQDGQSFMSGKLGQQVMGENISIWDDAHDVTGLPTAFDAEGMPKEQVMLIDKGIAAGIAYDSFTAGREEGKASTGHAPGGMPRNMFVAPGNASLQEMIASTERGLLVTRFHYIRPMAPLKALITGMTRDGLFLVENGEIRAAVKNLRFTQSIVEAMNRVEMLGSAARPHGPINCPPMKVSHFNFTGQAAH